MGFVIRWWGFVRSESNGIIAILTAVIALTGGIYAAFSYLQWTAVNDQLTELKNASRPYIFAQIGLSWPTGVSPKPEDVTEVPVTISLVNAGTSPALHVTGSDTLVGLDSDAYIKEHLSSCSFTYHNDERGFPLAPSQVPGSPGLTFTTQKRTLSDDEKRDVFVNKTKHIVALGSIKYSGVRPGEYRTDYCYVWDPDSLTSRHFAWSDCSCTSIQ